MLQKDLICSFFLQKIKKQLIQYPFEGATDWDGVNLDQVFPLPSKKINRKVTFWYFSRSVTFLSKNVLLSYYRKIFQNFEIQFYLTMSF